MTPLALGEKAPAFDDLLAAGRRRYSLSSFDAEQVLVIVFSCNGTRESIAALPATDVPRADTATHPPAHDLLTLTN